RAGLPLMTEKIPFFLLSIVASSITFVAQRQGGVVSSLQVVSLGGRLSIEFISYPRYFLEMLWRCSLAIIYPYRQGWSQVLTLSFLLLLIIVSWLAIKVSARCVSFSGSVAAPEASESGSCCLKYLPFGWFWFLGTLVPVIGLIQVGPQAIADRYTYIPSIGL